MDEHKTPEEIINDNAAPDAPETDAPEACAQPEEGTAGEPAAGEAEAAEAPAPAEKKPMSVRARHALRRGVAGLLAAIVLLAAFVVRSAPVERSSFYSISAASAVTIMLVQTLLNVFGTVDILPLTGVTFPFVSNGGSSMLCVWGLLAFVKAADTRQNASFSVKLPGRED